MTALGIQSKADGARARRGRSLSGRLLWLTFAFVLAAEILIYVPSVAGRHADLLASRIAAAQTAALALEEAENNEVSPRLRRELLANAGVKAVALKRDEARRLFLSDEQPGTVEVTYDLRERGFLDEVAGAWDALTAGRDRTIRIIDTPRLGGGQFIEAIADEAPIRAELFGYARSVLAISLSIALGAGALVFAVLNFALIAPIQRLVRSMTGFRENPEDPDRVLEPSGRSDEIGKAEEALAAMQADVRAALASRAHLAALGTAVAKINHDLRNILAGAQLATERLGRSADPEVRRQAERLVRTLDRAADLASNTLAYGRAGERAPDRREVALAEIVDEAAASAGARDDPRVAFENQVARDLALSADPDQLYRILLNLMRNAVQALAGAAARKRLAVSARTSESGVEIEVADEGPGIPEAVLPRLFEPFGGGARTRGTGLGLAIARELARGHGGDLTLIRTGPDGTTFRVLIAREAAA